MSESAPELGITDADRERIGDILAAAGNVGPATCATIRRRAKNGRTGADIARDDDIPWAEKTVTRHAFGRCTHDIDESAVDHTNVPNKAAIAAGKATPLTRSECAEVRRRHPAVEPQPAIAAVLGVSESSVWRHANGECSHEFESDGGRR